MIIELKGIQFANLGAQLMLYAVLSRLEFIHPNARIAVRESPRLTKSQRQSVAALRILPMRKRWLDLNACSYHFPRVFSSVLEKYDYVAEGDLDMTIDVSGYAYGDRWGSGPLRSTAEQINRFAACGKPYIFAPQAYGPFLRTKRDADYFASALKKADLIASRDTQSTICIRQLYGPQALSPEKLQQFPDLTFGLTGDFELSKQIGINEHTALIIPNVRMTDPIRSATQATKNYLELLVQISLKLKKMDFDVTILNHGGEEDRPICRDLQNALGGDKIRLIESADARQVKGVIGSAGLVVASRFHACVSALDQGVPCLATSWTHKYQELFNDFMLTDFVLENFDTATALSRVSALYERRDLIRQVCLQTTSEIRLRIDEFWTQVTQIALSVER